jgi:hypothetical protein
LRRDILDSLSGWRERTMSDYKLEIERWQPSPSQGQ